MYITWIRLAGVRSERKPSKKARAELNAGVAIPVRAACETTLRHESCQI